MLRRNIHHKIFSMFGSIWLCALVCLIVFVPVSVSATTIVELTDAEQVAYSDYIVHGTVTEMVSEQTETGLMVMRVTLRVHEWYKTPPEWSELPATMDFYIRGGTQGEYVQTVSGEFRPVLGDELVVMLEKIPRYEMRPMLVGLSYGAFIVDSTPITRVDGRRKLMRRIERRDIALHRRGHLRPEQAQIQSASDLETLKRLIIHQVKLENKSLTENRGTMEQKMP